MNIILIGFMGAGKSTMGIRMSYRMKQPFLDTDKYIERKAGCPIKELFATEGEEAFRQMETRTITELLDRGIKDHVIATGGGIVINRDNHELLKRLGVVVWLRVKPETVIERLSADVNRPLLQREDRDEVIRRLMDERSGYYGGCADVIVDVDGKPPERIMDEIFTKSRGVWKKKKRYIHG